MLSQSRHKAKIMKLILALSILIISLAGCGGVKPQDERVDRKYWNTRAEIENQLYQERLTLEAEAKQK
jgi:uncharacterized protein YceK